MPALCEIVKMRYIVTVSNLRLQVGVGKMQKKICLCAAVLFVTTCTFAISVKPLKVPPGGTISCSVKALSKRVLRRKVAVSHPSVTREIMNARSPMVTNVYYSARQVYSNPPLLYRLQNKIRRLVATEPRPLPAEYVAKKAHTSVSIAQYAQTPVAGYMDRPWKIVTGQEQFLSDMQSRLAEVYPAQERRYMGTCAGTLKGIEYMLEKGFRADGTLSEAMDLAYRSAKSTESSEHPGFFVISMATHEGGPVREAFILDFENKQWISFNKSKAEGWSQAVHNAPISENGARIIYDQLDEQFKLDHQGKELLAEKVLSNDGLTGVVLTPQDQIYVKKALEKGYYIHLEPIGKLYDLTEDLSRQLGGMKGLYDVYKLSFATAKGKRLYTPEELFPDVPKAE